MLSGDQRARYDPRNMGVGERSEKKSVKVSGHLSSNSGEIVRNGRWRAKGLCCVPSGMCCRSGEWQTGASIAGVCTKRQYLAVYREPLYRSMKLRVCVEFRRHGASNGWANPMKAIRSCRPPEITRDPFRAFF